MIPLPFLLSSWNFRWTPYPTLCLFPQAEDQRQVHSAPELHPDPIRNPRYERRELAWIKEQKGTVSRGCGGGSSLQQGKKSWQEEKDLGARARAVGDWPIAVHVFTCMGILTQTDIQTCGSVPPLITGAGQDA